MPGLMRGVARTAVVAGTATAVSGRVALEVHARGEVPVKPPAELADLPAAVDVKLSFDWTVSKAEKTAEAK